VAAWLASQSRTPARAPAALPGPPAAPRMFQVRVDVNRMSPPIWRRLVLASDMRLDDVHSVLQIAFGWTDSHLHSFTAGGGAYDPHAQRFLTPSDIAEGELGVAEADVRLDQVLGDVGDRLTYTYDFGDDWEHVVKLEAVSPLTDDGTRATCTGGRRAGPPEDVGGVWGYMELLAAMDGVGSDDPFLAEQLEWIGEDFDPARFDRDEVNEALRGPSLH